MQYHIPRWIYWSIVVGEFVVGVILGYVFGVHKC